MLAFIEAHFSAIVAIAVVLILILFIICLVAKLFKAAIGIFVLAIIVPVLFTIFWGDGYSYVSQFASLLEPKYQQQIEDAYQYYKEKDAEDPFVDYDAVSETVTSVFNDLSKQGQDTKDDLSDKFSDFTSSYFGTPTPSTGDTGAGS